MSTEKIELVLTIVGLSLFIIYILLGIIHRAKQLKKNFITVTEEADEKKSESTIEIVMDKLFSVGLELILFIYLAIKVFDEDGEVIVKILDALKSPWIIALFSIVLLSRIVKLITVMITIKYKEE